MLISCWIGCDTVVLLDGLPGISRLFILDDGGALELGEWESE